MIEKKKRYVHEERGERTDKKKKEKGCSRQLVMSIVNKNGVSPAQTSSQTYRTTSQCPRFWNFSVPTRTLCSRSIHTTHVAPRDSNGSRPSQACVAMWPADECNEGKHDQRAIYPWQVLARGHTKPRTTKLLAGLVHRVRLVSFLVLREGRRDGPHLKRVKNARRSLSIDTTPPQLTSSRWGHDMGDAGRFGRCAHAPQRRVRFQHPAAHRNACLAVPPISQ